MTVEGSGSLVVKSGRDDKSNMVLILVLRNFTIRHEMLRKDWSQSTEKWSELHKVGTF